MLYLFKKKFTEYTEKSLKRKQNYHTRIKGDDVYVTHIDKKGVKENDVWIIPVINPAAKERLGYPTQKPEILLEKIIKESQKSVKEKDAEIEKLGEEITWFEKGIEDCEEIKQSIDKEIEDYEIINLEEAKLLEKTRKKIQKIMK